MQSELFTWFMQCHCSDYGSETLFFSSLRHYEKTFEFSVASDLHLHARTICGNLRHRRYSVVTGEALKYVWRLGGGM